MKNITLSLQGVIILFVIFLAGTVFAQEATTSLTDVGQEVEAKVDPGLTSANTFYFVERAGEEIKRVFITDPLAQAEYAARLADERLMEATWLAEQGETKQLEKTVQLYTQEFNTATYAVVNADGTINQEKTLELQAELARTATQNLKTLNAVALNNVDAAYAVSLAEAQTIKRQTELMSAIAISDTETAAKIYKTAIDQSALEVSNKAASVSSGGKIRDLDESIQGFSTYVNYGRSIDNSEISGTAQNSLDDVTQLLTGLQINTRIDTSDGTLNDGRSTGVTSNTVNPNSNGTITANTGAPQITAGSAGAPAYQSSSNGGFSWQAYILNY